MLGNHSTNRLPPSSRLYVSKADLNHWSLATLCFSLPNTGRIGMCHHDQLKLWVLCFFKLSMSVSLEQKPRPNFFPKAYFIYYVYSVLCILHVYLHARRGHQISLQMVVSPHVSYWELNSGPLESQLVFLATEQSLQPLSNLFYSHSNLLKEFTLISLSLTAL